MSDALSFLEETYTAFPEALAVLLPHSIAVAEKAARIAEKVGADRDFVYEAALLHDIGIYATHAPSIGCYGDEPYIRHGIVGSLLLKSHPHFDKYAKVCETHIGVCITRDEIIENGLPLPHRSMVPQSVEEEIVAYSDCFFSKSRKHLTEEKPVEEILHKQKRHSERGADIFQNWHRRFGE